MLYTMCVYVCVCVCVCVCVRARAHQSIDESKNYKGSYSPKKEVSALFVSACLR